MSTETRYLPLRSQISCAFHKHLSRAHAALPRRVTRLWPRREVHVSDHLARDMGLSPTELEHRNLRLPSQHMVHPRL